MLVLSRRLRQSICLTGGIEVRVVDIDRNKIKLYFIAPKDVPIYRTEVLDRIEAQGTHQLPTEANESPPSDKQIGGLVLTRKEGEAVRIAHDIFVTVLAVKSNEVRIGILAPAHVIIKRRELLAEGEAF